MHAFQPPLKWFAPLSLVMLFAACGEKGDAVTSAPPKPQFTMGSGSASTLLGRATFSQEGGCARADRSRRDEDDDREECEDGNKLSVKRITGDWRVEVKARPDLDLAVQQIVFQPGGHSGWHSHPGPVFIQVISGTMTFYASDDQNCTPVVRSAGQGFLDVGERAHIARNETASPATNVVIYMAPPGAALRIDQPKPGNCPF